MKKKLKIAFFKNRLKTDLHWGVKLKIVVKSGVAKIILRYIFTMSHLVSMLRFAFNIYENTGSVIETSLLSILIQPLNKLSNDIRFTRYSRKFDSIRGRLSYRIWLKDGQRWAKCSRLNFLEKNDEKILAYVQFTSKFSRERP